MSYKKKRYSRKGKGKRRSGYNRYFGYAKKGINYGLKAYALAKSLKGLINVEYKYHDVVTAAYNAGVTPALTCVNIVPQGDTSSSRDGDSILMKSLNFKGFIKMDEAATEVTYLRVSLIQLTQTNGAALTAGGVWQAGSGGLFDKKRLLNYTDNIKILKNYNIMLQPGSKQSQILNLNWKFKDHVKYKGTAGTIADLMTVSLWVYVEAGSDTHKPEVQWSSRLRFIDN